MEETQFEDGETFNPNYMKDKITFRDIVLQHLRKISQFASCEFRGGYWEERPVGTGQYQTWVRVYVPDTREVFSNAVECFADMLFPYFDLEMKKAENENNKEKDRAFRNNTVIEKERNDATSEEGMLEERKFQTTADRITYRSQMRELNKKLFRELCSFLYRKKYLELGSIED